MSDRIEKIAKIGDSVAFSERSECGDIMPFGQAAVVNEEGLQEMLCVWV